MTSSKQEKRPAEVCRLLSAGLDFHRHSGASFLLSVRRFSRKHSVKIQPFFSTCQPVGAGSNAKTDGSRLVKGQGVAGGHDSFVYGRAITVYSAFLSVR